MAQNKRIPRNRLNIGKMRKNFDYKIECLTQRLKKWSTVFNKPVFTFKTKDKYDASLDVMPVEKYFDYLFDIHFTHTDHGSVEEMMKAIKEDGLWMPYEVVYVFHKFCTSCFLLRKIDFRRYYTRSIANQALNTARSRYLLRGFVEIIDMRSKPDGEYQYILHYKDLSTQFSRLRPLKNPVASEVAEELFQIFMTSGAPAVLHAPVKVAFTAAIIKNLESLIPNIKILVGAPKGSRKKQDQIPTLVDNWMENSKDNKWSMGIYYVESTMNTKKVKKRMSAYEAMFVRTPGTGLIKRFSNRPSRSLFTKLKNEEDLLLPSVEKYVVGAGADLAIKSPSNDREVWKEWCAICGNDAADSMCDVCGVAMHGTCNDANQQLCDCCRTFTAKHDHSKVRKCVSPKLVTPSVTDTQSNKIITTDKQLLKSTKLQNVDKSKPQAAKIRKTSERPGKVLEENETPSSPSSRSEVASAKVPKTDVSIGNIASTSTQLITTSIVNMNDYTTELKVNKITRQYVKRKKPLATQPSATVQSEESKDNVKKQKTVDLKEDAQNDTGKIQDNTVTVKQEAVAVIDSDVGARDNTTNVKDAAVSVTNDKFKIKQEVDMDIFENMNVFDEVLDIVKQDPF